MKPLLKDRYRIEEAAHHLADGDEALREDLYERMRSDHFQDIYNLAATLRPRDAREIPPMSQASEQYTLSREEVLRYAEFFNLLPEEKAKVEIEQRKKEEKKEPRPRVVFRINGEKWEIGFHGKTMKYGKLIGFERIHFLMNRPEETFWASELLESADPLNEKSQERPRKTVTNSIKNALLKIRDQDPEFWKYFKEAILTGYQCMYHPPADRPSLDL